MVTNLAVQVDTGSNAGIQIDTAASNVSLSNLSVTGGANGVVALGASATLTNLAINPNPNPANAGHGLIIRGSLVTVDTVTIGTVTKAGSNGIEVSGNSNTVRNCTVTSHPRGVFIAVGSNNVLQNCTITAQAGEGVLLAGASDNVIENNTIVRAATNGILLYPLDPAAAGNGSNRNLVMGNTVLRTDTQHGIAVQSSDSNVIVANTVNNSGASLPPPNQGADGILVLGGQDNRIDRNVLTGFTADGITLTPTPSGTLSPSVAGYRPTTGTYVGKNRVTGASTAHTGIWLNDSSNGSYVFNNTVTTGTEAGITNFNTSASMVEANVVSNFAQAGILAWNADRFPRPTDNVFRNNYVFDNPANGEILVRGLANTVIADNYFSLASSGTTSAGINFSSFTENGVFSGGSSQAEVYGNTVRNAIFPNFSTADTTAAVFFHNRYYPAPGGFNAMKAPASIKWDANVYAGGNFWSTFAASGNPGRTTPFRGFVDPATGSLTGHVDRFPFRDEDFGQDHAVAVFLPDARTIAAPGSNQTIAWRTNGCVLVDLAYGTPGSSTFIVTNYPDVGFYDWVVPAAPAGASYAVSVTCKNSSGLSLGTQGSSAAFTIAAGGLLLRSPGAEAMTNAGSALRVAWQRTGYAGGVDVYLQTSAGGSLALMIGGQTGDFADITLPSTSTSRAKIVIRAAASPAIQDSNDGYFSIRTDTGAFVNPSSATTLLIGRIVNLEWVSPQNSQFVDVELFDSDVNQFRTIYGNVRDFVLNLPDRGRYAYLIPERWMSNAHFRLTFKDANGATISTLNSPAFDIRYTLSTGSLTAFYRLFSPITFEHLLTTDSNEYNVLSGPGGGWVGESNPPAPVDQILTGDYQIGGVRAVPFYRLYNASSRQHHWTSSRHEYFVLRESPDFAPEHLVGYIFPSQVAGSTALYRLAYPLLPLHLWTSGANEYNVLSGPGGGWVGEGVAGYIFCAANDTQHPGCTSSLPPQSAMASASMVSALSTETFSLLQTGARALDTGSARPRVSWFVNTASAESANVVAPGEIVSLQGVGLGPAVPVESELVPGGRVPTQLAGVSVTFDGVPAPMLLASDLEIRVIVPNRLSGTDKVRVQAQVRGIPADPFRSRRCRGCAGPFHGGRQREGPIRRVESGRRCQLRGTPGSEGSGRQDLLDRRGPGDARTGRRRGALSGAPAPTALASVGADWRRALRGAGFACGPRSPGSTRARSSRTAGRLYGLCACRRDCRFENHPGGGDTDDSVESGSRIYFIA